jgi:hypothetical protein
MNITTSDVIALALLIVIGMLTLVYLGWQIADLLFG